MKKPMLKIIATSVLFCFSIALTSCDDEDIASNNGNTPNAGGNNSGGSSICHLDGKTFRYVGTQTTSSETTTPILSTTVTESNYDLNVEFQANGVSRVTGVNDIKSIRTTVAGISTNIAQGLGPTNIDGTGSYICSSSAPANPTAGSTLVFSEQQGGVTTTYTLNFTSATSGTYTTVFNSNTSGTATSGTSSGTFNQL